MSITKEMLEQKIQQMEMNQKRIQADYQAIAGAIQQCREFIAMVDAEETNKSALELVSKKEKSKK